jgi:hypothetical protein
MNGKRETNSSHIEAIIGHTGSFYSYILLPTMRKNRFATVYASRRRGWNIILFDQQMKILFKMDGLHTHAICRGEISKQQ